MVMITRPDNDDLPSPQGDPVPLSICSRGEDVLEEW